MNCMKLALGILLAIIVSGCTSSSTTNDVEEEVNLSRAECIQNHGMWDLDSGACIEAPEDENNCDDSGGRWIEATTDNKSTKSLPPTISESYCELPTADAGKSCTDKPHCDKYCRPICSNGAEDCQIEEMNQEHGECAKFWNSSFGKLWNDGKIEEWSTY